MKFGGSSVDTAQSIERVVGIVRGQRHRQPVVVVSAMAKTTRKLLEAADAAAAGDLDLPRAWALFEELRDYHWRESRAAVRPEGHPVLAAMLERYFGELHAVLEEINAAGRVTPRLADHVASFGELVSSAILSLALDSFQNGVEAPWIDCRQVLVTNSDFTRAKPVYEETEPRMREAILPHVEEGRVPVLGGYVGATIDGVITTLGKEGSDFSAAIVGAAIRAEEVQIWTDVDGILTADPRIVRMARRVRTLSFDEALELACSGAKKPHYGTLEPASRADVPIRILNSWHLHLASPQGIAEGTLIGRRTAAAAPGIKSIACKPGIHHLTVRPSGTGGFLDRVWEICERFRPSLLSLGADEHRAELSLEHADRLSEIREALEGFSRVEVGRGKTVITLVSEDLASSPGLAAMTLEMARPWEPRLVLQGVSAPCVRCLVDEREAEAVVAELHERVFPGPPGEPIE
ncbi:MAG TPA: aspartate kinase [Thermoanaerobaculia bacterium]|nr:aspartate kinase [Thermoanaerobaculia bacterium]